jgi:Plasmid pRiA4b ORF-3-like protein
MANASPTGEVYQLHAFLLDISPTIWRRLLVRSNATLADLHHILQIAFGHPRDDGNISGFEYTLVDDRQKRG